MTTGLLPRQSHEGHSGAASSKPPPRRNTVANSRPRRVHSSSAKEGRRCRGHRPQRARAPSCPAPGPWGTLHPGAPAPRVPLPGTGSGCCSSSALCSRPGRAALGHSCPADGREKPVCGSGLRRAPADRLRGSAPRERGTCPCDVPRGTSGHRGGEEEGEGPCSLLGEVELSLTLWTTWRNPGARLTRAPGSVRPWAKERRLVHVEKICDRIYWKENTRKRKPGGSINVLTERTVGTHSRTFQV